MIGRSTPTPRARVPHRTWLALLAATLVVGLAGCGGTSNEDSKAGEAAGRSTQTAAPSGASLSPSLGAQESQAKQQAAEESAAAAEEAERERTEAAEAGH